MPSVAPWPVVPIMVTAESCVAITDRPTAHHGRLRLARKYPSISFVPVERRMPWMTTYVSHPITTTQFSGCTLRGVAPLEEPQRAQRRDLDEHHARKRATKAARSVRVVAHRRAHASTNQAYAMSQTTRIVMWRLARNRLRRKTGSPGPMNCAESRPTA